MRFQTLVRVNSASGKSGEELQSHALFTPFLFALSKMSLRRPVQAPELQCSLCFSCPFLSCRVQRSSCKDTKQGDWGKSMALQRKRGDRGEECVEVQERRDTNERERKRQTDCWRWRSPFFFFFWKCIYFQAGARMWASESASWALVSQQHVGACHYRRRRDSYKFTTAAD